MCEPEPSRLWTSLGASDLDLPSTARVRELLEAPITAGDLIERLLSEYDVEPELCRKQVDVYLEGLRTRALLAETCA